MQLRSFPVLDRPAAMPAEREAALPAREAPSWVKVLKLVQPYRGLTSMVALACGAAMAGGDLLSPHRLPTLAIAMILVGPLLNGAGHAINAYFDRHLPGFAERRLEAPTRLTSDGIVATIGILCLLSLVLAHQLGAFAFNVTGLTLAIHFALNAPPLSLRRQSWWNGLFFGIVSVAGPWVLGVTLEGSVTQSAVELAAIFSFGAVGLHLLDTLHQGEGERRAGLQTLAAVFGPEVGAGIAALIINTSLLGAAIACAGAQVMHAALGIALTMLAQVTLQFVGFRQSAGKREAFAVMSFVLYMGAMALAASALGQQVLEL
ncbi:MAG TPA: UbiA family prenyltransferase [Pantanalinema sp.]